MPVDLPEPIAIYFSSDNSGDASKLGQCFDVNAVVRDEGHTYNGLTEIKQWRVDAKKKYQYTVQPISSIVKDGNIIVTNRLTGNFPGSPIDLQFVFGVVGNKITSLDIHP
jgi:hypothetical protein